MSNLPYRWVKPAYWDEAIHTLDSTSKAARILEKGDSHHYVDGLPRTPRFKRVVALLGDSAGAPGTAGLAPGTLEQVAEATIAASQHGLQEAKGDDAFGYCFYLLAALAQAT